MKRSNPDAQYDRLNPKPENVKDSPADDLGKSDPKKRLKIARKGAVAIAADSITEEQKTKQDSQGTRKPEETEKVTTDGEDKKEKSVAADSSKYDKTDKPCSSFTASLASFKKSSNEPTSLFGSSKPQGSSLFGNSGSLFGDASAKNDLFANATLLNGPFGSGPETEEKEVVENTEKEIVVENDEEEGFDVVWMDKSVALYGLEDGIFKNRGAGILKVLRKEGGDVNDRVVVFRKRGTLQLLLTARLSDNFIVGEEAKAMNNGMKGVLFSSAVLADGETDISQVKPSQFILKFKVDQNRTLFIGHVTLAKEAKK